MSEGADWGFSALNEVAELAKEVQKLTALVARLEERIIKLEAIPARGELPKGEPK